MIITVIIIKLSSANVEENNSVSRALTRLSEVEEKVESLHQEQVRLNNNNNNNALCSLLFNIIFRVIKIFTYLGRPSKIISH